MGGSTMTMIRERKMLEAFLVKKTRTTRAVAAGLSDVVLAQRVLAACGRRVVSKTIAVEVAKRKLELEVETKGGRRGSG
jgi:hypothetical protein